MVRQIGSFNIKYQYVNTIVDQNSNMGNAVLPSTNRHLFSLNQINSLNNVHTDCDFDSFTISKIYSWDVQR